ncbi:hypothetical protein ERJ75_001555100 [Trypanosoma vivax]|nr:hypothetical protein ERJ75_001555100 [Trypanosoma vivax]
MLSLAGIEGVGRRTGNFGSRGDTGTEGHGHRACETFDRRVDRGGASARRRERRTMRLDKRLGGSLVISRERRRAAGPVRFAPVLRQRRTWQTRDHEETGTQNRKRQALGWAKGKRGN